MKSRMHKDEATLRKELDLLRARRDATQDAIREVLADLQYLRQVECAEEIAEGEL